jgi:hypothetical protein
MTPRINSDGAPDFDAYQGIGVGCLYVGVAILCVACYVAGFLSAVALDFVSWVWL